MPRAINVKNILEVVSKYPGQRQNPQDESAVCVYTHPEKPGCHCIAGQILVDLGWGHKLPPVESYLNHEVVGDLLAATFTPAQFAAISDDARGLLTELQQEADRYQMTWGRARRTVLERRGL